MRERPQIAGLPLLLIIVVMVVMDDSAAVAAAKTHCQSPRLFIGNDLPICEPRTAQLAGNGDYPSGHATNGWSFALIMAHLQPERATAILARGHEYGERRQICGSHSPVEGAFLARSAIVAAAHGAPDFRRDMNSARAALSARSTRGGR